MAVAASSYRLNRVAMSKTYSVDDLRNPRLSPTQRQMLEATEGLAVDFDIDTVIDQAVQSSGVKNFDGEGLDDDFRKRLGAHFDAIEADDMTVLSRMTLRERSVRCSSIACLFTDLMRRYPEIDDIEIENRSSWIGNATFGHHPFRHLIAADERRRALPYWESRSRSRMPGEAPGYGRVDPRYGPRRRRASVRPGVHADRAGDPRPLARAIERRSSSTSTSPTTSWSGTPACRVWRDYYLQLDQTKHYAYMKRVLKALTFRAGPAPGCSRRRSTASRSRPCWRPSPTPRSHHAPRSGAVIQSSITLMAYGDRIRRYYRGHRLGRRLLGRPSRTPAGRMRAGSRPDPCRSPASTSPPPPQRQRNPPSSNPCTSVAVSS
jgi:hypothetical protein